jgi:hypothetical protein
MTSVEIKEESKLDPPAKKEESSAKEAKVKSLVKEGGILEPPGLEMKLEEIKLEAKEYQLKSLCM